MLLCALERYFSYQHYLDAGDRQSSRWDMLDRFGRTLCEGDVVITFNYDSTWSGSSCAKVNSLPGRLWL